MLPKRILSRRARASSSKRCNGRTTCIGLSARRAASPKRSHNQEWAASPKEGPQPEVGCQPGPVVLTAGARESCCSLLRDDCPATRSADGPVSRALPARRCTAKLRNASAPQRDMGLQATWGIIRSKWAQQALPAVPSPHGGAQWHLLLAVQLLARPRPAVCGACAAVYWPLASKPPRFE